MSPCPAVRCGISRTGRRRSNSGPTESAPKGNRASAVSSATPLLLRLRASGHATWALAKLRPAPSTAHTVYRRLFCDIARLQLSDPGKVRVGRPADKRGDEFKRQVATTPANLRSRFLRSGVTRVNSHDPSEGCGDLFLVAFSSVGRSTDTALSSVT
jgi:hypothetical protein